jgi:hypothetical protein
MEATTMPTNPTPNRKARPSTEVKTADLLSTKAAQASGQGGLLREEGSFGVVIVADRPTVLLSALRKQWLKLCRKVQRQSASTLQATRLRELQENIITMQTLRFATTSPADQYPPDVYIATIPGIIRHPPICRTLYITTSITPAQLAAITAHMPADTLVVMCVLP